MLRLPYGISNFSSVIKENYLYIDKTDFIEKLENLNSKYLFFIRPRRFGKSLFLSMLEYYYDFKKADQFLELFGNLAIGKKPTPQKNQYLVLKLNFSGLETDSKEGLYRSFTQRVVHSILEFLENYNEFINPSTLLRETINTESSASGALYALIKLLGQSERKLYLIIDEYDHFANDLIAVGDGQSYQEIIRAAGLVRDFYETVKIGTESVIDRIIITGISPIMLDDLTSGFNITTNITMSKLTNEMLGFTEDEVRLIIEQVDWKGDQNELLLQLRSYYNGYLFYLKANERVYNPDMVLYFFTQWMMSGEFPDQLVDDNVKTDYGRLERLTRHKENQRVLEKIIQNERITTEIVPRFSFDRIYDEEYFVSLLYYMGLLTIGGSKYGVTELKIPNFVVKTIYWEYFERKLREQYEIKYEATDLYKAIWRLAYEGDVGEYIHFISEKVLKSLSYRDYIQFDEKYIKIILFSFLTFGNYYRPVSEHEVENGYVDIYLEKDWRFPDVTYEWIWELKYVKKAEAGQLEKIKAEGLAQLEKYSLSRQFSSKNQLKKALIIFIGKSEYLIIES